MRTNITQLAANILDADTKHSLDYLYEITLADSTIVYYMSTKKKVYDGNTYSDAGEPFITDFSGITFRNNAGFSGLILPSSISFRISNSDATLDPNDFFDASVVIRVLMSADISTKSSTDVVIDGMYEEAENVVETEIMSWAFIIKNVNQVYGRLNVFAIDWMYRYLQDTYPNTPLVSSLWPTAHVPDDNYCVPKIFGTCFLPVRWDKSDETADDFYILGEYGGSGVTHILTCVRDPKRSHISYTESNSNCSFTITENKEADDGNQYSTVQIEILPGAGNAIWDAIEHSDVPVKYSRSDTASTTNPIAIIKTVLLEFGIPESKINTTAYNEAYNICKLRGITFSAPFFIKGNREDIINKLLVMANCRLFEREQLHFKINSTTPDHTLNSSWIVSRQQNAEGEFTIQNLPKETMDSGYILYRPTDLPITEPVKILVSAGSTTDNISDDVIDCTFMDNVIHAQKIGIMTMQKKLLRSATISTTIKMKGLQLEVGDTLAIEGENYGAVGGNYNTIITEVRINPDNTITLNAIKFRTDLDDWDDLSPSTIVIVEDDDLGGYSQVYSGVTALSEGGYSPNDVYGPLRFVTGADLEFETTAVLNVNTVIYTFTNEGLFIEVDHVLDIGSATNAFHDIYAYNFNDVGDYYFMDSRRLVDGKVVKVNDLSVINKMKPGKDFDTRSGFNLIDDDSIPDWLYVRDKKTGSVLRNKEGKPYFNTKSFISLIFGAIRQMYKRILAIEKKLKIQDSKDE